MINLFVIRHGESEANVDRNKYFDMPSSQLQLTEKGRQQAIRVGKELQTLHSFQQHRKCLPISSPLKCAFQTTQEILSTFPQLTYRVRTEPLLREVDWGSYYTRKCEPNEDFEKRLDHMKADHFFYKFPNGESIAEAYDRVSTFLYAKLLPMSQTREFEDTCFVLVTHGIIMKIIDYIFDCGVTVDEFENRKHPKNCEIRQYHLENLLI